jgi:hypothetical protein
MNLFGISLPPIGDVLFVGAGLVAPPLVAAQLVRFLPDSIKTNQAATWGVKVASVVLPGIAIRKFVSPRAGNLFMVGGAASLVVDAIRQFAPGVIPGLGYQPLLAGYSTLPGLPANASPRARSMRPVSQPAILEGVPDRLSPQGRF